MISELRSSRSTEHVTSQMCVFACVCAVFMMRREQIESNVSTCSHECGVWVSECLCVCACVCWRVRYGNIVERVNKTTHFHNPWLGLSGGNKLQHPGQHRGSVAPGVLDSCWWPWFSFMLYRSFDGSDHMLSYNNLARILLRWLCCVLWCNAEQCNNPATNSAFQMQSAMKPFFWYVENFHHTFFSNADVLTLSCCYCCIFIILKKTKSGVKSLKIIPGELHMSMWKFSHSV